LFSAKSAALNLEPGATPRENNAFKKYSAESAIHSRDLQSIKVSLPG
jgi:hypothetical protein